jgi:dienelactone hydrolase
VPANAQDSVPITIALPEPWGEHAVGVHAIAVVDSTRRAPDADGVEVPRPVLVRIWYPAEPGDGPPRPYMSDAVAEAWRTTLPVPSGWQRHVRTHAVDDAPVSRAQARWPVLLFSHGRSFPVENYQILFERLASAGWVVAAMSHPGEEALTELPGGEQFPFNGPGWDDEAERGAVLTGVVDQLVLDASRVLDRLEALDGSGDSRFAHRFDLAGGVGYFGHSLGGAAAVWTLQRDPRVVAAASWEGQVYRDADRPLVVAGPLLYIVGGANRDELLGRQFRPTGPEAPVFEVVIHGAWHASVGELLYIYRPYAPRDWKNRHRRELTAARVNQVTGDYLEAFFVHYLLGRRDAPEDDLLRPDPPGGAVQAWNYPEVELRMSTDDGFWTAASETP